ncbi:hypothetical protein H9P43_004251 [Blastocladiella emersonii ATCC 22665]|nr:hypothetical protein H9P43_004251 [Blastocladiella emersonii ATCC 22665]
MFTPQLSLSRSVTRDPDVVVPGHGVVFNIRSLNEAWDAVGEIVHRGISSIGVDADGTEENVILTFGYTVPGTREARCFTLDLEGLTQDETAPFHECVSLILSHPNILKVFHNCHGDGRRIHSSIPIDMIAPAEDLGEWVRLWCEESKQVTANVEEFKEEFDDNADSAGSDSTGKAAGGGRISSALAPSLLIEYNDNGWRMALNETLAATGCPQNQRKKRISQELKKATKAAPAPKPIPIEIREEDLEEKFVKGGGNGGQKTSNCVLLTHKPTGIQVRCHETRSLSDNRRIARKLLRQKLDDHVNGELSKRNQKEAAERRKKLKKAQKARKKYAAAAGDTTTHTAMSPESSLSSPSAVDANPAAVGSEEAKSRAA